MERVVQPLSLMGAQIRSNGGKPPLEIEGGELRGIHYRLPVASAQVKSAVLLAGLAAEGETVVVEPVPTRDHTERLLQSLGVGLARDGGAITVSGGQRPHQFSLSIPGDFSSAAFFLAGAALTRSEVTVVEVGLNPTRTAFLDVLSHMGLDVQVRNRHERTGEPVGDVTTIGSPVRPVQLGATDVPLLIDELPLVALLATQADGTSYIHGAEELRVKETDRISGVARVLSAFGGRVEELADGFAIRGPTRLRGAQVSSGGDHRLALLAAVAGAAAEGDTYVDSAEAAAVSLPEFPILFSKLGGRIDAV
jgi:3-phosphoshikimate 1-carboxyvinyltransferase